MAKLRRLGASSIPSLRSRRGAKLRMRIKRQSGAPLGPAARRARRHQGHHRHRPLSDRERHPLFRRQTAHERCLRRPPVEGGRRDHPRQDGDDRTRLFRPRQDPQSARSRTHARRLVVRIGRCRRGFPWPARTRHPDGGLDPAPCLLLRRARHEAHLWPCLARRRTHPVSAPRHHRRLRPHRRRHGHPHRCHVGHRRRR